ncbi:MAG TPA: condensation domain-containing protein, partial [Ktedonobacteraceae bacterium]|nr:condensation domain-containing protein [Ktedonobacteraceae bacterium]
MRGQANCRLKRAPPVEENEADIFPMSFAQRRMWFFYQLDPADPAYNVPLAIRLTGRLHCEILERCINALIERHEGLRTTFKLVDDQPVQVVWPELSLPLPLVDLTGSTEEEIERSVAEQARQPFDLVVGPVIRTTLFRLGKHEHIFLLNCHHIAVDGWALGIFYRELQTLYNAYIENTLPALPALPIQYADFTQWQLQKLQGETLEKLLHYWKRQLGGNLPTLRLPVEQSRQGVRSAHGARLPVVHSPQTLEKLHQFCRRTGATLFMVLLAAFQTLLHRYSGQDDILVGSPIANRNRVEIEGIIGFFANTLVLRTDLSGDPTFLDLLERVREVTLGAYAHQDLPFERLVEELQPERSLKQNPLFQHIFALQKPPEMARKFAGLQAELIEYQSNIIKFDLEFILWESAGELTGFMNYNQDLFSAETIAHMIEHWLILVDDAVSFPTKHVSELALMSALEWRQVLRETQPASSQEANEVSLLHCFEQQVARTPEKPALLAGEILLNYQQLARKVYRLARSLRSWGVKAEVPVGLLMDHSIDEVVCLLAILKAGGACVPLDPTIPPESLSFIIKDVNLHILLTKQRYLHHLPPTHPELVVLCTSEGEIAQGQGHEDGDLPDDTEPGKLASILYVANRGILLEHGGLLEHVRWRQATFPISPEDTVLLSPLPGSMQALWEILWSLLQGACLYLSGEEQRDDPAAFWRFVNEHQASVIHTTPAQLKAFPATFGVQARLLLCYGEQLAPATIETLGPHFNGTLHLLAPLPEAATCIAYASLAPEEQFAGEPLRAVAPTHVQMYILDKYRQPLPVGIPGELFVASGGLARGYTHGTSDERFFTHAFNLAPALPGRIFQTRQYARLLRDGTLELLASLDRRVTLHGYELSLPLIEEALLRNASVVDCAVLLREAALGTPVLVAYVVLNSSLSVERLEAHMHQLLPPLMAPAFYVPVSAIPLTLDGEIDEPALCSLEIIERELLRHWEERLLSIPEIERVAVLAQERREELPLLHLSDLFSDWREMFGQTAAPRSASAALSSMNETPDAQERKLAQTSGAELVIEPHAPRTLAE